MTPRSLSTPFLWMTAPTTTPPRKPKRAKRKARTQDQKLQQQESQQESHCRHAEQSSASSLLSFIGSFIIEYRLSLLLARFLLAWNKVSFYSWKSSWAPHLDARDCAVSVAIFVVDVHHHVIVVSVVQIFLFFLQQFWRLCLCQSPSVKIVNRYQIL